MKKGCWFALLTWGLAAAAYWYWLRDRFDPPANIWVPIIAGFFMAMVVGMIRTAFSAVGDVRRVRRALEPGGFMGEQPRDGENIAVAGHIRPLGMPLTAPFSHKQAVLYNYDVEHPGSSSSRNNTGPVKDYSGLALTPSVIDTMRGQVKLLCFPQLEGVRFTVVHETGGSNGRDARMATTYPDTDVLVFGHSHIPWDTTARTGLRLLNPGSPTDRRRQPFCTYMTATVADSALSNVELCRV